MWHTHPKLGDSGSGKKLCVLGPGLDFSQPQIPQLQSRRAGLRSVTVVCGKNSKALRAYVLGCEREKEAVGEGPAGHQHLSVLSRDAGVERALLA